MTYFDGLWEAAVQKWERLDPLFSTEGIGIVVAGDLTSIRYLTGYLPYLTLAPTHGQAAVYVVGRGRPVLYPISYYERYARETFPWLEVRAPHADTAGLIDDLTDLTRQNGQNGSRVGVIGLTPSEERDVRARFGEDVVDVAGLVADARAVKTPAEVELLRDSVRISEIGMAAALDAVHAGLTECDVAASAESAMRVEGCESHAIVIGGNNASRMHEISTDRPLRDGETVLIDLGCYRRGYRAEYARSTQVGSLSDDVQQLLGVVSRAVAKAAAQLRPGMTCGDVEAAATAVIGDAGYGDYAHPYPVGHGLGVSGSEHPMIVPHSDYVLQPNMVMNVEPGIFIPEEHIGIRIEDIWLTREGEPELLTTSVAHVE